MNTYPGIITSRRTRRNLRHFRLLPINPPTESAVQFRAARALNQLSSHASLLVGKWRHCRNSTNYQHHIWRPEKISNSVTLFAVRPIIVILVSRSCCDISRERDRVRTRRNGGASWQKSRTSGFKLAQSYGLGDSPFRFYNAQLRFFVL